MPFLAAFIPYVLNIRGFFFVGKKFNDGIARASIDVKNIG